MTHNWYTAAVTVTLRCQLDTCQITQETCNWTCLKAFLGRTSKERKAHFQRGWHLRAGGPNIKRAKENAVTSACLHFFLSKYLSLPLSSDSSFLGLPKYSDTQLSRELAGLQPHTVTAETSSLVNWVTRVLCASSKQLLLDSPAPTVLTNQISPL